MKNSIGWMIGIGALIVVCIPPQAAAEDSPRAAFRDLFGQAERDVRRTKETDDDAQFAQRLLAEAMSGKHPAELTRYLYDKAYEYALRDPQGFPVASQVLDRLLEADEAMAFEIAEMRLALLEKWHEALPDARGSEMESFIDYGLQLCEAASHAGDWDRALRLLNRINRFAARIDSPRKNDVRDSMSELVRMRKLRATIAELEEQLGTEPTAADQLAMLYLAELDDPSKAATYAAQMNDRALAAEVTLASMAFALASRDEAHRTGVFYLRLVDDGETRETVAMLIRARVWLIEYLTRELGDADAQTVQTTHAMLGEIDTALLKRGIGKKLRRKMSSLVRGEGQFDRPEAIQDAIDKGVEWLYTQHNDRSHWEQNNPTHRNWGGYTALVAYALLMADEDPRINADLSRAVHFMMNTEMSGTYALCFRIHAWEVLPYRERYRQTLNGDVQRLRKGATRHGYWGYTTSGHDVQPGTRLDTSTTLAGGLGLWIGEAVGGISTKEIYWERTVRALIDNQLDDDGWSYNPVVEKTAQGAMTAGALTLLHAGYPHLSEATRTRADEAIARGMRWMDTNFSPTTHVNRAGFKNYYFAAVQHVGLFAGRRDFREMDWYESIAEHLVKTQAHNGAWGGVSETAFAVAFLCRGGIVYEPSENAEPPIDPDAPAQAPAIEQTSEPVPSAEPAPDASAAAPSK